MEILVKNQGKSTIIAAEGSLDALTVQQFNAALEEQVAQGNFQLILDFTLVNYSSSAGIRGILNIIKEIRARNGKVCLAGVQDRVRNTFEICGLPSVIQLFPDVEMALKHWNESSANS